MLFRDNVVSSTTSHIKKIGLLVIRGEMLGHARSSHIWNMP